MQFTTQYRTDFQRLLASDTNLFCFQWVDHSKVVLCDVFKVFKKKPKQNNKQHSQALPEVMKSLFLSVHLLCVVVLPSLAFTLSHWLNFTQSFFFFFTGTKNKYCAQRCLVKIDAQSELILWLLILMKQTE